MRWSAAKGIGRITSRLTSILAEEVLASVLELFSPGEVSHVVSLTLFSFHVFHNNITSLPCCSFSDYSYDFCLSSIVAILVVLLTIKSNFVFLF